MSHTSIFPSEEPIPCLVLLMFLHKSLGLLGGSIQALEPMNNEADHLQIIHNKHIMQKKCLVISKLHFKGMMTKSLAHIYS